MTGVCSWVGGIVLCLWCVVYVLGCYVCVWFVLFVVCVVFFSSFLLSVHPVVSFLQPIICTNQLYCHTLSVSLGGGMCGLVFCNKFIAD